MIFSLSLIFFSNLLSRFSFYFFPSCLHILNYLCSLYLSLLILFNLTFFSLSFFQFLIFPLSLFFSFIYIYFSSLLYFSLPLLIVFLWTIWNLNIYCPSPSFICIVFFFGYINFLFLHLFLSLFVAPSLSPCFPFLQLPISPPLLPSPLRLPPSPSLYISLPLSLWYLSPESEICLPTLRKLLTTLQGIEYTGSTQYRDQFYTPTPV